MVGLEEDCVGATRTVDKEIYVLQINIEDKCTHKISRHHIPETELNGN